MTRSEWVAKGEGQAVRVKKERKKRLVSQERRKKDNKQKISLRVRAWQGGWELDHGTFHSPTHRFGPGEFQSNGPSSKNHWSGR